VCKKPHLLEFWMSEFDAVDGSSTGIAMC